MNNLKSSRWLRSVALLILTFGLYQAQAQVQTARHVSMGPNTNGFYEYLPQGYHSNPNQTYPLIVFIHGMGELGNGGPGDLPKLLWTGLAASINVGELPVSLTVNGQTHSFIVISPQFVNWPSPQDINGVLDYVASHYRVNPNRIYLTGLSMGGGVVWDYVGNNATYANRVAAIVPICGASWPEYGRARTIANANVAVWAHHNQHDPTVPVGYTNDYLAQINQAPAPNPVAKASIYPSWSHDAWTFTYNSTNRDESGRTIYQWMLQYARGNAAPSNQMPVVNAGPDQTITGTSTNLSGTASDPDGNIASYSWTRVSGPTNVTFSSPGLPNTSVSGLTSGGTYVFRLSVTDNMGATSSDEVSVTKPLTAPGRVEAENYAAMSGIQTENCSEGGRNIGWQDNGDWMDYSINVTAAGNYTVGFRVATIFTGAQFQLRNSSGATLATVTVPNTGSFQGWTTVNANVSLPGGQQTLRVVTTNAAGGWNFNYMDFTQSSAPANQAPTANAGAAQTITLPTSSATLSGSGTDADGTIASYQWSQVTGPANAAFSNASSAQTTVSNLVQGTYTFQLRVTDNGGSSATSNVTVTVNAAPATGGGGTGGTVRYEAENYTAMHGVVKETTQDVGGGQNIGYQDNGDWMDYSVNVPSAGTYTFNFRVATANTGAQFQVRNAGGTVLQTVTVPNTTWYQVWQTTSAQIALPAGQQTLRIFTSNFAGGWNINWFEIAGAGSGSTNGAPTVNAGPAQTVSGTSATLSGSATDADGTIASYAWSQVTGPNNATFATANAASTQVNNLVAGTYTFKLTATDNSGASASANVTITVTTATNNTGSTTRIEAENFVSMQGIQVEGTADAGGGQNVGWQDNNDWMDYSVNLATAGTYAVNFRVATMFSGAQFQLRRTDGTVVATVNVPNTGGFQTWQTINANVSLPAGQQNLRIYTTNAAGGWNINWWEIQAASATPPPPPPASSSQKIEAENYTAMHGVVKETTQDVGGGQNIGYQDNGDWMDYSVNIASAGTYTFNFRVATANTGAQFQVRNAGGQVLKTVTVPNTTWYQVWETTSTQIQLPAGQQTLRIFTSNFAGGWNLNWFEIVGGSTGTQSNATAEVEVVGAAASVGVFPNPVADRFLLQVNNELTGSMNVQLTNMSGAAVKGFNLRKAAKGSSQTYLSIGALPRGEYLLTVSMGDWMKTVKVIKQ